MSSDDGWLLRKNKDEEFCLQMYFASLEELPNIDEATLVYNTLEEAIAKYENIENEGYPSEYGLSVRLQT